MTAAPHPKGGLPRGAITTTARRSLGLAVLFAVLVVLQGLLMFTSPTSVGWTIVRTALMALWLIFTLRYLHSYRILRSAERAAVPDSEST